MPRNARFSEWSPNLAFWTWDDLIHYLNLTTWCKQYERYLCRIWSRHGGSFTSSVSWHQKSLYDNVIIRNCATKISNHATHLWDVRCTAEIVFQTWSIRKFGQRFGKQVFHSDSTPLVRFHVWQNDKDAIARLRPPAVSRGSWTPVSLCWEVLQLL